MMKTFVMYNHPRAQVKCPQQQRRYYHALSVPEQQTLQNVSCRDMVTACKLIVSKIGMELHQAFNINSDKKF